MSTKKLRVLTLLNYCFPGGTCNRVLGMVHGLDPDRFDHTIAMIMERSPQVDEQYGTMIPQFERDGVTVRTLGEGPPSAGLSAPARVAQSVQRLRRSVKKLSTLVRELNIDVIDSHNAAANIVGVLAGRATNTPTVATLYYVGAPPPVALWPIVGRVSLDLATIVLTDSHARARDIRTWLYRRKDKVEVIPNGVPLRRSAMTREEVRASLGIPQDATVITQVAGLVPHKGGMVLLEAAREVLAQERGVHFLLIGHSRSEPEFKVALEKRTHELGIDAHVTITGYEGPIEDVWRASDIQAHASLFDSLPAAIIEAMSASMPAVVTSVAGIPELVRDGETGIVVPPNDPQTFARALLRLIREPATAQLMGAAAFRRYEQYYTPTVTVRGLEDVFCRCARS